MSENVSAGATEASIPSEVPSAAPEINQNQAPTEAPEAPSPESQAEAEARYEVTVDGQKIQLTRDQLVNGWQTNAAAFKRFQEAAELRKEAERAIATLKENPLKAYLEMGGDESAFRALAENYLYDKLQYEKMSPEQQELMELRKYREEQENQRQAEAKRREEENLSKQASQLRDSYAKTFTQALTSANVPATPKAIAAIAQLQYDAMEQGYEMPIEVAVDYYKEQVFNDLRGHLDNLGVEQLIETLGGRVKDIRNHEISTLKNPAPKSKSTQSSPKKDTPKRSASEFFASLKP